MVDMFGINHLIMFYTKQYEGLHINAYYDIRSFKFRVVVKCGKNEWSKSETCFTTYAAQRMLNAIVIDFLAKGCYSNG